MCGRQPHTRTFSTLCGPIGCGTHLPIQSPVDPLAFQYPLRAYRVWNFLFQTGYPMDAELSVPSAGL